MESPIGGDAVRPHATFEEMDLSPEVRQAITQDMKYAAPTPVQSAAFGPIREGKDVVVQSRTGTGKTAAFGLPTADRIDPNLKAPQLLVLAPTRELANQVNTELERINKYNGNRAVAIYGGSAFGPQLDALKAGAQIVAGTPGRVLDHLRRGTLKLDQLRFFILDEADEMLSMGFQDELESILEFVPKKRQSMLFSATFPPEIKQIIERYLKEPHEIMLSSGNISVDKITHYYYVTSHMRKPQTLLTVLEHEEPDAALVFCNTRDDANWIGSFLKGRGHDAEVLTGELTQSQREKVMAKIKAGRLRYLVATDVAARGIDITDLSHVINYNLPMEAEVYVHRTGRTGRAGKSGTAVSIVSGLDISTLYALTRWMKIAVEERPIPTEAEVRLHKLDKVVKRLVGEVRGRLEEGLIAPDDRNLLLAERILAQPQAKEVVALLLERGLGSAGIAPGAPVLPAAAGQPVTQAAVSNPPAGEAGATGEAVPETPISKEQLEFEERQMRSKSERSGGRGGSSRGGREGGERGGREGGGERGGRSGASDRGGRGGSSERGGPGGGRDRERGARGGSSGSSSDRGGSRDRDRSSQRPAAPASDSKTLMVTLGRKQKMGSREVGLFIVEASGVEVNAIRDVRVRDGYSFVDVDPAVADKILGTRFDKEVDGHKVKVELARTQRGDAPREGGRESRGAAPAASPAVAAASAPGGEGSNG